MVCSRGSRRRAFVGSPSVDQLVEDGQSEYQSGYGRSSENDARYKHGRWFAREAHEGELSSEVRQLINSLKMASQNTNRATADLQKMMHDINTGDGLLARLIKDSFRRKSVS